MSACRAKGCGRNWRTSLPESWTPALCGVWRTRADRGPGNRQPIVVCGAARTPQSAFLDPGDTLVVPNLDRYGRSLQDLINMVAELRERGIGFTSLHENLDTTTPGGRLVFHVFAVLAEFIRELIVIGTNKAWPPPAIYCPTPAARSPRSPSCWASLQAPSSTTSRTGRELRAGAVPRQLEAPTR
ncbi:recombinase family protein [Streptomyces atroolivaceus]|uniref:recombinase family protein n=1 Tax=Streptomyces atroolivaceus TaxID=66869 RepID=UPI00362FD438